MSVPAAYLTVILIWSTTPLAIQWSLNGDSFLLALTARMAIGVVICFALLKILKIRMPLHRDALETYLAAGLGIVVGSTILTLIFVIIVIPLGWLTGKAGKSSIVLKPSGNTYYKERNHTYKKEDLENPW